MAQSENRNFLLCIKGVCQCLSPNVWSQVSSQKVLFYVGSIKLENVKHGASVNFELLWKMSALGKSFVGLTGILLLTAGYIYIFKSCWQPLCSKPFVKIGDRCYFFSSNKEPSYEYYKIVYKNRAFSVPVTV
nr:uncharacterized protein LOC108021579 isoform X3 [Drosophila suzukii]